MSGQLTILILGGYGTFGGRLARLLADDERLCSEYRFPSCSHRAAIHTNTPSAAGFISMWRSRTRSRG